MEEAEQKKAEEAEKKDEEGADSDKKEDEKQDETMQVDGNNKGDEKKDDEKKEEEDVEMEEDNEEPPRVELSDDEKAQLFHVHPVKDLTEHTVNQFMAKFSLPDKSEGFDNVVYEWQGVADAGTYMKNKVQEKKILARLDNLLPGEWFREKLAVWTKKNPRVANKAS